MLLSTTNVVIDNIRNILDEHNISATIIEDNVENYHKEVEKQNYDYILVNSLHMVANMNLAFNLGTYPTYLITRKDNESLMDDFDNAMQRLNDKEYLFKESLYLKYFSHDLSTEDYISNEEFELLQSQSIYNVGVINLYNTFGYTNNSEFIGSSYDVMEKIADIANINVNYVQLDINFDNNDTSELDFYFVPVGYSVENDDVKSNSFMTTPFVLVESLIGNSDTIGVLASNNFTSEFINYFCPNHNLIEFDTVNSLYLAFSGGGVDNLFISQAHYNLIYQKILEVEHTTKNTNYYQNLTIRFNENFPQDKINVINKLISYIDDDFIQTSSLKSSSAIKNRENSDYFKEYTRMFLIGICMAGFVLFKAKQQKDITLKEVATHDQLTGLLTLNKFIDETRILLDNTPDEEYTLISFDIDNFKYINEIYGYEVGSKILTQISTMINSQLYPELPISRVLADNFILVAKTKVFQAQIEIFLKPNNDILKELSQHLEGDYILNFSIGSYNIIDKALDISYMIDCCNLARSFSKRELGTTFNAFSDDMKEQEKIKNDIVANMNQAITDREFVLYYQPKFDIITMKTTGAEALVRWFSDGKMIPPNNFIPLFETNGFIENLDYYVIERACEFIAKNDNNDNLDLPKISVNLSGITIMKRNVVDKIMEIVESHKVKPAQLDLEITESAFVDHFETALESIDKFRELGFTISMDDFGAGISSLNRLKEISIDILKIDREFIVGSLENEKGSKIIRNIVNMAKDLNLETVAEGIETNEQLDFLRNLGCDIGQGYYYSRPLPENDFLDLLLDVKK